MTSFVHAKYDSNGTQLIDPNRSHGSVITTDSTDPTNTPTGLVDQGNRPIAAGGSSATTYLGVAASRCTAPNFSYGSARYLDSHSIHTAISPISNILLEYHNFFGVNEANSASDFTVQSSVEYPIDSGFITPVLAGGLLLGTVPMNGYLAMDRTKLIKAIPKGAKFKIRTHRICATGGTYPIFRDSISTSFGAISGESCTSSNTADVPNTVLGGVCGTSDNIRGLTYRPSVIADTISAITFFIVGDSRDAAAYAFEENLNINGYQGKIARALGGRIATVNGAVASDSFTNIVGAGNKPYVNRLRLSTYCSHVLCALGINDGTMTLAQYKTFTLALKNKVAANKPFWVDTIYPMTSTSDFWLTTANQITLRPNIAGINAAIRAGQIGTYIDNYIDTCAGVESYQGSGLWGVGSLRIVTDGVTGAANTGSDFTITSAAAAFTSADLGKCVTAYKQISITSITWAANVATVTAPAHGLPAIAGVIIANATPSGYNTRIDGNSESVIVTRVDANTFTYDLTTNPGGSATTAVAYFRAVTSFIIKTVNSASSITGTNMTGDVNSALVTTGALVLIGQKTTDGLHAQATTEVDMAAYANVKNALDLV